MASIEAVLAGLDPPLKHLCEMHGDTLHLTLTDPSVPATVKREVAKHEYKDPISFQLLVLYAINEIRRKGSHAPLEVIPVIDPLQMQ
jgi:hypothetical protein